MDRYECWGIDPYGVCLDGKVERWLRGCVPTPEQVRLINEAIADWVEYDPDGFSETEALRLDTRVEEILGGVTILRQLP